MGAAQKIEPLPEKIEVLFTQYDQPHIAGSLCSKLSNQGKGAHGGWSIHVDAVGIHASKGVIELHVPWTRVRVVTRTKGDE